MNNRIMNNNLLRSAENTLSLYEDDKNLFKQSPNPFGEEYNANIFNSPSHMKSDMHDSSFSLYKRSNATDEENMISNFALKRNDSFDIQDMFKNNTYVKEEDNNDNPLSFDESYFSISSVEKDKK